MYMNIETITCSPDKMGSADRRSVQVRSTPRADDMGRTATSQPDHVVRSHRVTYRRDESPNTRARFSTRMYMEKIDLFNANASHPGSASTRAVLSASKQLSGHHGTHLAARRLCDGRSPRAPHPHTAPGSTAHSCQSSASPWLQLAFSLHPARIQLASSSHSARIMLALCSLALSSLSARSALNCRSCHSQPACPQLMLRLPLALTEKPPFNRRACRAEHGRLLRWPIRQHSQD